jgi:phosphoribosylanthranilate isomerase
MSPGLVHAASGVRIKLCGVRRAEDAALCVDAGANEIGIIFAPHSRRCVDVKTAREIRLAVPPEIVLVGVFQDATLQQAERIAADVGLTALQFHGKLPADHHARLRMYAALQIDGEESLARVASAAGFHRVLLDGPAGGSGASFAWSLARKVRAGLARLPQPGGVAAPSGDPAVSIVELFIAGGLTPENVRQAIREARPDGVDVASGIEGDDGFKDPERVRAFVEAVREAS